MTAETTLAVAGAHLAGQPLHPFLLGLGARYVATTTTAPVYRMVALPAVPAAAGRPGVPPRPGLIRGLAGASLEVELYRLPVAMLGALVVTVAPPLAIGAVLLSGGAEVLGFVCEAYVQGTVDDITHLGGWRPYLARDHANSPPDLLP